MATYYSPKIITDGLVLCLDAANIKSFRGEPTTNIVQPAWSSWGIDGSGQGSVGTRTIYSDYYCRIVDSAANTRQSIWAYNASPSTTYTFSVKYKKIAGTPTLRFQIQPYAGATYQSSVFPTTAQIGIIDTDDWQTATHSVTGNASTDRFLWFIQDGDDYTTYTHTFELKEAQVEAKTYYTPFVSGSRGTTVETGGGLYDLTNGNNNGTLTNGPTFNAANGGSIVFDGTNDYVSITQTLTTPFTITGFVRYTDQSKAQNTYMNTDPHPVLGISLNRTGDGSLHVYIGNGSGWLATPSIISSINMSINQWYQVTFTSTGSGSILYLNGVNVGTSIYSPSGWGSTYYFGSLNFLGEYLRGNIATTQIYNRALSASEVLQNYNAMKPRFSL